METATKIERIERNEGLFVRRSADVAREPSHREGGRHSALPSLRGSALERADTLASLKRWDVEGFVLTPYIEPQYGIIERVSRVGMFGLMTFLLYQMVPAFLG